MNFLSHNSLGFQSSDSSSLDSDSSISDNETGLTFTFMDSECSVGQSANQQQFGDNLIDLNEKSNEPDDLNEQVLKENVDIGNVFLLNASMNGQQPNDLEESTSGQEASSFRRLSNVDKSDRDSNEYTITEFSSMKRTKNTSIQNIISQYERQQQILMNGAKKPNRIERQASFDEIKLNLKQPLLKSMKSMKQRHLFPSKSIDQPMLDLDEQQTPTANSKFSFVKKNFEKLLNPLNSLNQIKQKDEKKSTETNKITIHEKQIEKPTKHLTIKQCIRKIDLNTTHQNIIKHLENDVSLNQESSTLRPSIRTNKSSNELSQLNSQPHCPIILKHTKEIAGYNTISDAFLRLDFYNAIRDIRRFNYVCKLLHLLITQNLTSLSGCATKFLFNLLEEIAFQGMIPLIN